MKKWFTKKPVLSSFSIAIVSWLVYLLVMLTIGKDFSDLGPFGDMFGGLNTLFTGLAFAGLIVTIILQLEQNKSEQTQRFESTYFKFIEVQQILIDKIDSYVGKVDGTLAGERQHFFLSVNSGKENKASIAHLLRFFEVDLAEDYYHYQDVLIENKYVILKDVNSFVLAYDNFIFILKYINESKMLDAEQKRFYSDIMKYQINKDVLHMYLEFSEIKNLVINNKQSQNDVWLLNTFIK